MGRLLFAIFFSLFPLCGWAVEATNAPATTAPPSGGVLLGSPEKCQFIKEKRDGLIEIRKNLEADLQKQKEKHAAEDKAKIKRNVDAAKSSGNEGDYEGVRLYIRNLSGASPNHMFCRVSDDIEETLACIDASLKELEKEYEAYDCLKRISEPFYPEAKH